MPLTALTEAPVLVGFEVAYTDDTRAEVGPVMRLRAYNGSIPVEIEVKVDPVPSEEWDGTYWTSPQQAIDVAAAFEEWGYELP